MRCGHGLCLLAWSRCPAGSAHPMPRPAPSSFSGFFFARACFPRIALRPGRCTAGARCEPLGSKGDVDQTWTRPTVAAAQNAGTLPQNFGCSARRFKMTERPLVAGLPRSPIGPLQRHYNVHRIFLEKSTTRLRHPRGRLDPAGGRVCRCPGRRLEVPLGSWRRPGRLF